MSNIELQKLRLTVEKASQQNRMLAVANSQMLSELTSSKERLKALQHELGCTVAVLRLKSLALDEKEKLNKELNAKIRIMEKKMHNELYDNTRAEGVSTCAEVVAGAYIGTNSMGCNQSRRRTLGNETLGSTTFTHQAEEKPANEPDENIRAEEEKLNGQLNEKNNDEEEHSKCTEVATDTSGCHSVDKNMAYKPKRRILRSESLGASAATLTHQVEAKDKDTRRKSSRRRSNINFTSEERESKDNLLDIENVEVPSCPVISEPPIKDNPVQSNSSATVTCRIEPEEEVGTRVRRSSRKRANNQKSEQSKEHFAETADIRARSPIPDPEERSLPPPNSDAPLKHEESKTQTLHRTPARRPTRRAAEKVTSYKEIPLNVKMRRNE
ncbi:uncharacterized protein A4U43_C01F7120 [Asparagus officinalis]|uniref:Shugoshin C-terminal domain-containing protein n=1 Tax=Asparagus officinalis TaxID=4686 RepID=A0A5P1FP65_ASPOF|nr:SHUGOSHIN 2-like [Asparagus officinalis]ONK79513.1 uncharacterized protein A4U43_C01F7120 [Asparagus officinalis]